MVLAASGSWVIEKSSQERWSNRQPEIASGNWVLGIGVTAHGRSLSKTFTLTVTPTAKQA